MGDLFGGGGSSTKVEIPTWLQEPMQRGISRAEELARMGYQPYYGPEVAAFTPMQQQAMQSQYDAAAAFGMAPMGGNAMAGIPTPTEFTGGLLGYSSGDLFEQSINEFQKRQPEQAAIYNSQFVGPDVSNQSFYPSTPPGPPYRGIPGGSGGVPLTGGYGNANPNTSQGSSGYTPYGGPNQFTDYSNPYSTYNPFGGYGMPVVAGGGPINQVPGSTSGGSAPVITDRPYVDGQYPGGYPTTPSNPGGIPIDNNIMYGQNMYNQGQTFQPETVTPPAQNEAMAMDLWSQAQKAMDSGSLSDADKFLTQYQNITGTRDPMFGLGALDPSGYYASKNQGMVM